jgi:hypothetical protein
VDWREAALAEATSLKPYFVAKHGWMPEIVDGGGAEVVDLFVHLHGRRFPDQEFALRLRYQPDWQQAGRREAFVDPLNRDRSGPEFWPPEGNGLNPNYAWNGVITPVICLRGVWGFHSVLHAERPMDKEDTALVQLLVELQKVLDG